MSSHRSLPPAYQTYYPTSGSANFARSSGGAGDFGSYGPPVNEGGPPSPSASSSNRLTSAGPYSAGTKVSCSECRSSKVKCLPLTQSSAPSDPCARCERLGKHCIYEKHKRGRKPDEFRYGKLEKQLEAILHELKSDRNGNDETREGDGVDDQEGRSSKRLRRETAEILSNWASRRSSGRHCSESPAGPSRLSATTRRTMEDSNASTLPDTSTLSADDDGHTDGDEELGAQRYMPSQSNPLKLLADASAANDEEEDRHLHQTLVSSSDGRQELGHPQAASSPAAREEAGPSSLRPSPRRKTDALGLYDAKPETSSALDPILSDQLTEQQARSLWATFLAQLSHRIMLLDANVYTFEYCRSHSPMLLSVGLALTARLIKATEAFPTAEIAERLDKHVLHTIIPVVLLQGKRSVHIVKALIFLAAYNGCSFPMSEDRSFSYVSWAFAMSVELDMNSKMLSVNADPNDEALQRRLRERERTYLSAWTYSFSICLHSGRRCSLSLDDPLVMASSTWHLNKYALPEDAGVVSNVQLRRLIARNLDYYLRHIAPFMPGRSSEEQAPSESCRLLLAFHHRSISEDLDAWHSAWVQPARGTAGFNDHGSAAPPPVRLQSNGLYHAYASLILHSLPLRLDQAKTQHRSVQRQAGDPTAPQGDDLIAKFRREADGAALNCLSAFLQLSQDQITWSHNSLFVTVGYAAVYALISSSVSSDRRAGRTSTAEAVMMSIQTTLGIVERVTARMQEAGSVTAHRKGFASVYVEFLRKLIKIHKLKLRRAELEEQSKEQGVSALSEQRRGDSSSQTLSEVSNTRRRAESREQPPPARLSNGVLDPALAPASGGPMSPVAVQHTATPRDGTGSGQNSHGLIAAPPTDSADQDNASVGALNLPGDFDFDFDSVLSSSNLDPTTSTSTSAPLASTDSTAAAASRMMDDLLAQWQPLGLHFGSVWQDSLSMDGHEYVDGTMQSQ